MVGTFQEAYTNAIVHLLHQLQHGKLQQRMRRRKKKTLLTAILSENMED